MATPLCCKLSMGMISLLVLVLAIALTMPEYILPSKIDIAVNLMGWQGLLNVTGQAVAERLLGMKKTQSRMSYHSIVESLLELDSEYLSADRAVISDQDIADGHRLATHLLRIGFDFYLEQHPSSPVIKRLVTPNRKMMGDNPDALYYFAPINLTATGGHGYTLSGTKTDEIYLSVTVYGSEVPGGFASRVISHLNFHDMAFDANGEYTVTLSYDKNEARGFNWLFLPDGDLTVVTRHYFEQETPAALDLNINPNVHIHSLNTHPTPPVKLDDVEMGRRLSHVANFVKGHSTNRPKQDPTNAPPWFSFLPNTIGKPALWGQEANQKDGGMGAMDIAYAAGYFRLNDDEALVISGRIPTCVFANVVLWNRYYRVATG